MHQHRKTLIAALMGLACLVSTTVLAPTPASAEPDIDQVSKRVETLLEDAERAQERFNLASVELQSLRRELGALRSTVRSQEAEAEVLRQALASGIVDRFQGSTIGTVGQVVVSDDPDLFLAQLASLDSYRQIQNDAYGDYETALRGLDLRQLATLERASEVADLKDQLAKEKQTVDEKYAEAKTLLDKLEAAERDAILSGALAVPTNISASGRAGVAVRFAMAQIGDPYVYGAAGPNTWDCSGLTMMAWNAAGIGLPHSSSAQFSSGAHVSASQLQPGDLVFYYSPISHVGMYIGRGLIVHAPHPGARVEVVGLYHMPFTGAVRPG